MLKFTENRTVVDGIQCVDNDVKLDRFVAIDASEDQPVSLSGRNRIGSFVKLGPSVELGVGTTCDDYVSVGKGSRIGDETQLLYGATVHELVTIGARCIVSGDVGNWTVIEDEVTFMGRIVHRQNHPHGLETWGSAPVPSPVIRSRAFIGENAMLLGGITIGHGAYIDLGEVVKTDIPDEHVQIGGRVAPIRDFRGYISSRPS